ncbi:hypothetical protein JL721_2444 [Aureococcus anophagefferens]|nr:hypothetical protein JL721_2444 [Aureococcus anophagefferens]
MDERSGSMRRSVSRANEHKKHRHHHTSQPRPHAALDERSGSMRQHVSKKNLVALDIEGAAPRPAAPRPTSPRWSPRLSRSQSFSEVFRRPSRLIMEEFESLGFTDHMRDQILPKDGSPHRSQGRAVAGHAIAVRLARTYGVFNEQSPHFTAFVDRIRRGEIDMEEHGRKHSLKAGKTDASFFADKIGRNVMRRLRHDRGMLASYANLIIFVVHILVFMSVIALQRGVEGTERYQFFAIRDALLGFSNATTENGESYVRDFLLDFDTFEDFLRGDVLGMIFQDSECGDALCEPRDENPNYEPDPYEREAASFVGCRADCGIVDTTPVEFRFFDTSKLDVASAVMAAALDDGWLDKSAMAWGARTDGGEVLVKPVAGWNVCHASDHYWGTPETVCLFDGDVQINGRPYRTAELDFESSFFGESKVLDLYAGDWELRYAFDGFAWTYPYSTVDDPLAGQTVQIGFPAIRGACACSYVDNVYRCFDDAYWAGFNAETMTHSTLKDDDVDIEMAAFPDSVAYEAIAKWWQIPRAPAATSAWGDRSAPAAVANASAWNPRVRKFSLVLLNVYASLTWLGNTVSILDAAGEVVTSETLTDTGCAVVDVLLSEGRTYAFERATTEAGDQYHAGMGWALYDGDALVLRGSGDVQACTFTGFATPDAVVSVFDYRCYGDGASSSGDANATAAPTPAAAAYALPPDDAVAAVDCAFDADLCNYEDGGGNGGPWTFFVGRTGTPNSGPKEFGDRSDADDGFAYVEASGTSNDTFILRSPAFAALAEPALLTFKLHAYGDRVAYMNLEGLVGGTWEVLFRTVYDQGHRWHEKSAEVPAATTRIRWRGFTYFWTGDIAIDDVAFAAAAAPTPAPTASEDDGRLRCYAGWKRYSEGDADFLAGQWQQDPSSEIVTCPADDTHCVLLEYAWPFAGGGVGWNGFNEPTKARMLLADMIHAGYDFPDPGPLDPRLCMNVKSEYYEQHALLSDCLACAGDLCNVPGAQDPAWYANVFNVSAQALGASGEYFLDELGVVNRISAQGMDTETGVFCSPQRMADGVCDLPQSGFACLHDGGDCLDDEHAYVAAPWVRYRKGEDGALDDWPYALVLGKPPQAHATVPHVLWRAVFDRVFLEGAAGNFTGEARVGNLAEPRGPPLAAVDPAKASESWDDVARYLPSAACPECAAYAGDFATVPFTVEGSGVPYGFFYDSGCPGARDFPVVFDTNLNRTRALELFDTLTEGAYLDKQTLDATVQMATVNVETGLLTYIEIVAERVKEGGIRVTDSYRVFDPRPYDSDSDVARAFLELANVAIVLALIFVEIRELWHTYAVTGGIWDYVLSGSNFIDVLGYVVSLVMFAEWLHFWRLAARIRPLAHYDAYADIDAVGRITGASGDVDAIQDQYEDIKRASNSLARYDEYIAVAMIMMAFQLLKNLDFHPRIGMISRTVRAATTDLTYFIIVFLFVLEIYAFLGVLLHGKVHEDFENLFASSLTMMKALCGMFDDSAIEVTFINAAFYWSFMVLSFFLLLNSLLAIIVEAYTSVVEAGRAEQHTDPLPFTLWKLRQDAAIWGWRVLLPGLRRKSGRGREAAHEDLFLSVAELSDILECWFDAEDRPSRRGRRSGRAGGCPVSWRNFAWRWQKDNANDPIVCLDHHFLCCIFRILHARYEARMADEGAPPAEPPLCDEGVDVLVWNVLVRYGGKSADIDNSGHTTQHEMTALARLLRLQKTYDAHPDIDDGTALCAALNYFNGVSTQAEMEANFARELELDADLAELHHAGPDAPDDAVPSSHELSYCGTL